MAMFFFARFHVAAGSERAAEDALERILQPTRKEPGCLAINAFRSTKDRRLFYIHSHWKDEEAFEVHASLEHTVHFVERMESLVDEPFELSRTEMIG